HIAIDGQGFKPTQLHIMQVIGDNVDAAYLGGFGCAGALNGNASSSTRTMYVVVTDGDIANAGSCHVNCAFQPGEIAYLEVLDPAHGGAAADTNGRFAPAMRIRHVQNGRIGWIRLQHDT